jgi:hypothetical protein
VFELIAASPALPLDEAGKYVAGAYVVFVVLLVVYVAIMAMKLSRIEAELKDLANFVEGKEAPPRAETRATPGREEAGVK